MLASGGTGAAVRLFDFDKFAAVVVASCNATAGWFTSCHGTVSGSGIGETAGSLLGEGEGLLGAAASLP